MFFLPSPTFCSKCGAPLSRLAAGLACPACILQQARTPTDPQTPAPAQLFPELEIQRPLGPGRAGTTLMALHRLLLNPVVLSLPDATGTTPWPEFQSPDELTRLVHPGLVPVLDAGKRAGRSFTLTDFIPGKDARALVLQHGRLPFPEACEIVRQAAHVLQYLHERRHYLQRLKPSDLIVTPGTHGRNYVKIVAATLLLPDPESRSGISRFTAPEVAHSTPPHARNDVYTLGAILFHLLTGGTQEATAHPAQTGRKSPRISGHHAPRALADLCAVMMAENPSLRPASAAEVASRLARWTRHADLGRLLHDVPLTGQPTPARRHRLLRPGLSALALTLALTAIIPRLYRKSPPLPAGTVSPVVHPFLSDRTMAARRMAPEFAPRLLTPDWERDFEILEDQPVHSARFQPDGAVIYLLSDFSTGALSIWKHAPDGTRSPLASVGPPKGVFALTADDTSGHILWNRMEDPMGLHVGRADGTGNILPPLRFNFASEEIFQGLYEAVRADLMKRGSAVPDGKPGGLATVTAGQIPPDSGLQPGDVLIADQGHRNLGVKHSEPGLWRCRAQSDAPAERLGSLPPAGHFPIDVTVAKSGVFLLNRTELFPSDPGADPTPPRHRLFRWDRDGFHPCPTDHVLEDPSAVAADPSSTDLYVVEGAFAPSPTLSSQRVHRLRRTGPDAYQTTLIADRFGRFAPCSVALNSDGSRLILTDTGNRLIVCLKRRTH